ncbi:alpha/beta hydrolase [Nocardioides sp. NPDC087217]|uniref:alpha/beta hydrolase n=1 Tax=Nocardioides sp. NPDC087217 TaxID=3364335 RepID=UPI00381C6764
MATLDPQVRDLLASLSKAPPALPWDVPIASYRSAGEKLAALAGLPNSRCDARDIVIDLPGRSIGARIYRPKGPVGSLPGVVYFHGGGFVRGSLESHDSLCRELSVRGGLSVVSVDYRLAPENVFPRAHDDAIDSFCWLSDHAGELKMSPDALAVAGDSAGAMLAASTAVGVQNRLAGLPVRAQGLLCPVLDVTLTNDSVTKYEQAPLLSRQVLAWCVDQYFPNLETRQSAAASPLMKSTLADAPAAIILSSEIDPVSDDARQYSAKLKKFGVESEHQEFAGMPHSFFLLAGVLEQGERAIATFAEKLSALLR